MRVIEHARRARRCSATCKRTGLACQGPAVGGWSVCRHHGGKKSPAPSKRITSPLHVIEAMRHKKWWRKWDAADEQARLRMAHTVAKQLDRLERKRLAIKTPVPAKRIGSPANPWPDARWARFGAYVEEGRPAFEIAILMNMTERAVRARRSEWRRGKRSSKQSWKRYGEGRDPVRRARLTAMIEAGVSAKNIAAALGLSPGTARKERSRWLKKMGRPARPTGRPPRSKERHDLYPGAVLS